MNPDEKRKELERNILQIISEKLQNGEIDAQRAEDIAKMILIKLHPPLTLEQIYQIAPTLDDSFTELSRAVLPLIKEHDTRIRDVVSLHVEKLIKEGNFDQADALLKQTLRR